jgi:hypothetical protein
LNKCTSYGYICSRSNLGLLKDERRNSHVYAIGDHPK